MKKILLIEDDPVEGFITEQILRHVGFPYELHKAIQGAEGINLLQKLCASGECPHLILLDLYMPILDGFGFLEEFALLDLPNKSEVNVIVLTMTHDATGIERALSLGAKGVLHKPLQLEKLKHLIEMTRDND